MSSEHNNAPAVPVAWWIPKAEQFCLAKPSGERPFAKAWEPLYAAPALVPVTPDPEKWCQYVAGMIFCWLQMQKHLPDEDHCTEAIAGIIQRRLWAYKPAAQEPVTLTDEEIDKVALEATGYDGFGTQQMNSHDLRNVVHGAIAALREKGQA